MSVGRPAALLLMLAVSACERHDSALTTQPPMESIEQLPDTALAALSRVRFLFGHQSVGNNVLTGIGELAARDARIVVPIVPLAAGSLPSRGITQFIVGTNGQPASKTAAFREAVDSLAPDGGNAGFELCYLDFTETTDVAAVFENYRQTVEDIRLRYPGVRLVHFTAPLTVQEPRWKHLVKLVLQRRTTLTLNAQRARFNVMMRETYGSRDPLFDLARAESLLEDGRRSTDRDGDLLVESLALEFAEDEGHLNARGRHVVAGRFLAFLATLD